MSERLEATVRTALQRVAERDEAERNAVYDEIVRHGRRWAAAEILTLRRQVRRMRFIRATSREDAQ